MIKIVKAITAVFAFAGAFAMWAFSI